MGLNRFSFSPPQCTLSQRTFRRSLERLRSAVEWKSPYLPQAVKLPHLGVPFMAICESPASIELHGTLG